MSFGFGSFGGAGGFVERGALVDQPAGSLPLGSVATVADLGDGKPASYVLVEDARAADDVLRLPALGRSGCLWVAGDGEALPRFYATPEVNWMATTGGTPVTWFGGAIAAADLRFMAMSSSSFRLIATTFAATAGNPVTTTMTWNAGNDASKTNLSPSQAVPTAAAWNAAITAAVSAPFFSGVNGATQKIVPLSSPVLLDITVAAAGANLTTFRGRFVTFGAIISPDWVTP